MADILNSIVPIILLFVTGFLSKKFKLVNKKDGGTFLRVVFYLTLPALLFLSISNVQLTMEFALLPLVAVLLVIITFFGSFFTGKLLKLPQPTLGVFLVGSMIMNIGFVYPFIILALGDEGFARAVLFDLGNNVMIYTFVYFTACKFGGNKKSKAILQRLFLSPPLWALAAALMFNLLSLQLPLALNNFLEAIGSLTVPLITIALGIYFNPKIVKFVPLSLGVFMRSGFGLLMGLVLVRLFGLGGLSKTVVLLGAAAPVGFMTITFAALEKLDADFASSLVSLSMLIGFLLTPILLFLL